MRDQVEALQRRDDVDLELAKFPPGTRHYLTAIPALLRKRHFDVVHAHFGLTAVPALACGGTIRGVTLHGNDLVASSSRRVTLCVLPRYEVIGVPSELARAMLPGAQAERASILPCGIDLRTFHPVDRRDARRALGLDPDRPFALFPFDPARPVKRHDRALEAAGRHPLHSLGKATREEMRLWFNAASIVISPGDWETFGMACVEAVACGTSVLATPTGVHEEVLDPLPWSECNPFDAERWRTLVDHAITEDRQHPDGPAHAAAWSSDVMAERLVRAWQVALDRRRQPQG